MKILIAEDSFHQREALQSLLEDWGFEVESVSDGKSAWEILRREGTPALAVLDSVIPGMSGPEICRRFREEFPGRPHHLILLTVRATQEEVEKGLEAGADDYVAKPFDEEELRARIRVGLRSIKLQLDLASSLRALEAAVQRDRKVEETNPVCRSCGTPRDEKKEGKPEAGREAPPPGAQQPFPGGFAPPAWQGLQIPRPEPRRGTTSLPASDAFPKA
jgi:sigma-B regulation protein RsbU (phosphoserine phosphatase)